MRLTDRTILVTGGTSGIGRAFAEALHARGNRVIIAGRRQALLDAVIDANPGMRGVRTDLASAASIEALARTIRDDFPGLDVLVNNAGISRPENLRAGGVPADVSIARSILETNAVAVLHLTAALLPLLERQAEATILTTTSGLAFLPRADFPTYSASKAFLHSWLQSLRVQLRGTSVEVLELVAPYVQTELTGSAQASDPHAMPVAAYVAELLAQLASPTPANGEIVSKRSEMLRRAERNGNYEATFAARNGGQSAPSMHQGATESRDPSATQGDS